MFEQICGSSGLVCQFHPLLHHWNIFPACRPARRDAVLAHLPALIESGTCQSDGAAPPLPVDLIHDFIELGTFKRIGTLQKEMPLDRGIGLQLQQHHAGLGIGVPGSVNALQNPQCGLGQLQGVITGL